MLVDNLPLSPFGSIITATISDGTSVDCDSVDVGSGGSIFWYYDAARDGNKQGGLLMTTWNSDSSAAEIVRLSTASDADYGVGDSSDLSIAVVIEGSKVILRATSVNNWTIKCRRLSL